MSNTMTAAAQSAAGISVTLSRLEIGWLDIESGVTDADNISAANPTGTITGPVAYFWQVEDRPGSGVFNHHMSQDPPMMLLASLSRFA